MFTANWVYRRGGAVANYGTMSAERVTMSGNHGGIIGGAFANYGIAQISGSTFADNTSNYGGAIYDSTYSSMYLSGDRIALTISDSVFTGNRGGLGGAIYHSYSGGKATVNDSVLLDNTAIQEGSSIYFSDGTGYGIGKLTITNSCIMDRTRSGVFDELWVGGIIAADNWWGSTTGPGGIAPGLGTKIASGQSLVYEPFLTEPILGCGIFPPTGTDQTFDIAHEQPVAITLSAVDGTPPYSYPGFTGPENGTLSGTAPDLIYTPDPGFFGVDTFIFDVSDAEGQTGTGQITINVAPPLVATDKTVYALHDTPVNFTLQASGGVAKPPYTFAIETPPSNGALTGTVPNLTYTPAADFGGTDMLTFTVTDANGTTDTGTISIIVNGPLLAISQTVYTFTDTAIPVTFQASDGKPPYTFVVSSLPTSGALIGSGPSVTYVPFEAFQGTDLFTFTATDANNTSSLGTIAVIVSGSALQVPAGDTAGLIAAVNTGNDSPTPVRISLAADSIYPVGTSLPPVTGDITLIGNGATLDGSGGALSVADGGTLTLNTLTITGGSGIQNDGGVLLIINSTIYENTGGVTTSGGDTQIINSTITANVTAHGGVYNTSSGMTSLTNATISDNQGGGLTNDSGQIVIENTLIAGNPCAGVIQSNGHNIESGNSCGLTASGDHPNTDPQLQPLADNSGPTLTQAINRTSAAIDGANNAACYWADQRGADRPVDGDDNGSAICDVGAYEYAVLQPPENLSTSPAAADSVDLTWTDHSPDESAFHIERMADNEFVYTEIATVGADVTTYTDSGLACSTSYVYRVRAYRSSDDTFSAYSNLANFSNTTACPPPAAPSDLTATGVSTAQIDLAWTDHTDDEESFLIERAPAGSDDWEEIGTVGTNVTAYADDGLACGTAYDYRVRVYRSKGPQYSDYSNVATGQPPTTVRWTGVPPDERRTD